MAIYTFFFYFLQYKKVEIFFVKNYFQMFAEKQKNDPTKFSKRCFYFRLKCMPRRNYPAPKQNAGGFPTQIHPFIKKYTAAIPSGTGHEIPAPGHHCTDVF